MEQLVLPKECRCSINQGITQHTTGWSPGEGETLERIKEQFFWLMMRKDISNYCKTCETRAASMEPDKSAHVPSVSNA